MFTLIWFDAKTRRFADNPPQHTETFATYFLAEARGYEVWKSGQAAYAYIWDAHRVVWERK